VTDLPIFFLAAMALAILFTWVFNHIGGSVFITNLPHTSVDTPQAVRIPLFVAAIYTNLLSALLIAVGVPALMLLIFTQGRLGYLPSQGAALLQTVFKAPAIG
jgi:uncharacterized protein